MKKSLCMIFVLLLSFSFFGCKQEKAETTSQPTTAADGSYQPQKDHYKFVFIPKVVHPWYESVKQGIEMAQKDYSAKGIEIEYSWDATVQADVLEQLKKLEAAASKGPDAISIAVLDASVTNAVIDDMINSGVKVCTFDTDAPESKRIFYCGHADNYGDGANLAKILAESIGEKGEVAILAGSLSAPNHKERVQGFKDEIAKYPNITIVAEQADNDSLEKAISLTEGMLQSYPDLKGIFGCNASNPVGAALAVEDAGKSGSIAIVGMDDDPETISFIEKGVITATMVQNVKEIGYNSVEAMIKIADGVTLEKDTKEVGAFLVTKDSLDNYHEVTGK